MKVFFVLVGAVCLMGGLHAQTGYVTDIVAAALGTSRANLTATIKRVNTTMNTADQVVLTAWNKLCQDLITLYKSYQTKYSKYTTVDLSQINNAITNMQNMMTNNKPQPMTYWGQQIFDLSNALQVETAMNKSAVNMTAGGGAACPNPNAGTCVKKYAPMLAAAPIVLDRIANCIATEEARFTIIGTNVTTLYAEFPNMVKNYLTLDAMCDIPTVAALSNPNNPPSNNCFNSYLQRFSNLPSYFYNAEYSSMMQLQLVGARVQRCQRLVLVDIQDQLNIVLGKFYNCLSTGV